MDYDVANYSIPELLQLFKLPEKPTDEEIDEAAEKSTEKTQDPEMRQFILDASIKLKQGLEEASRPVFQTEVRRGNINPDEKNTMTRLINIDSQYRMLLEKDNVNTDTFTMDLTEPLTNVLSITLYSLEIPLSWYNFSKKKGNTSFAVEISNQFRILNGELSSNKHFGVATIEDGNYQPSELITAVKNAYAIMLLYDKYNATTLEEGQTIATLNGPMLDCSYNAISGKYTWIMTLSEDDDLEIYDYVLRLVWFDPTNEALTNLCGSAPSINSTLGWHLGFRYEYTQFFQLNSTGTMTDKERVSVETPSFVNTNGTRYVTMMLNDFRHNRMTKGLVGISTFRNKYIRESAPANFMNQKTVWSATSVASAPRTLTNSQLFAANSKSENNIPDPRVRQMSPDTSDILAKIPLKRTTADWSDPSKLYVDFSGPLQTVVREYFGPVNISTLSVSLTDDRGNPLGLNGMDWSCSLLVKQLYSY